MSDNWWAGMTYSEYEQEKERRREEANRKYEERQRDMERRESVPLYELIGQTVRHIAVSEDGGHLEVETEQGTFTYNACIDGDGAAWWASVHGVANLLREQVLTCTTFRPEPREGGHRREWGIREIGISMTTAKGQIDIVVQGYGDEPRVELAEEDDESRAFQRIRSDWKG